MNRVFPIVDEENNSSADTMSRKIEMLVNRVSVQ